MKASAVNCAPWSVLKISGRPLTQRLTQGIETEATVEGVGKLPGEHVAAMPVDDSDQVHEATQQRHIGDVCAPDLVDMRNRQSCAKGKDSACALCPGELLLFLG